MSKIIKTKQSGFTLVETLIAVGFIVIVAALITSTTIVTQRMFFGQKSEARLQRDSRMAMSYLKQDIRMTFAVLNEYPEGSEQPSYITSSQTIVLKMRSLDSSGGPIAGAYDYIIYSMGNEGFTKTVIADGSSSRESNNELFSEYVQDIKILYDGTTYEYAPHPVSTVNIYIKVAPDPETEEDVFELQTEIMVRNANR